jgi:hypothetical protein
MAPEGLHKFLTAAGIVLLIVLIFYVIRLNERVDRQEGRAAASNEAAQCSASCEASYATEQRRCSGYSYDGTRDWCRDQAWTVRSSCLSRCPR